MKLFLPFLIHLFLSLTIDCYSQTKCTTYKLIFKGNGDTIKQIYSIRDLDSIGRETRIQYFREGKLSYRADCSFNYKNKLIKEDIILDFFGTMDTSTAYYFYDRKGRLKKKITMKYKEVVGKIKYFYDGKNSLLDRERRSNGMSAVYKYDSLGNNTEIEYSQNGDRNYIVKYDYNDKNQNIHSTTSAYPDWHNYNLYDKYGNLVEFLRFNDKGKLIQRIKYYYNSQNKLIKEENFNEETNEANFIFLSVYENT